MHHRCQFWYRGACILCLRKLWSYRHCSLVRKHNRIGRVASNIAKIGYAIKVQIFACDIASAESVKRLAERVQSVFGRLNMIFVGLGIRDAFSRKYRGEKLKAFESILRYNASLLAHYPFLSTASLTVHISYVTLESFVHMLEGMPRGFVPNASRVLKTSTSSSPSQYDSDMAKRAPVYHYSQSRKLDPLHVG
ncbi:hypothetical protein BJ878DRAFT_218672 [Calycina marina]|uniref:Uncharacterized protein n=1 Tax=Calycina marina TaxID=1763456 RepID=A0A9P7YX45_9HELO|nr:hypothetical protein BJ878DRAFT_218672 [Calycina marina]